MNIIERSDLLAMYGQYVEESVEEHAAMISYCELECRACRKKEVAVAIEKLLGLEDDLMDKALE